VNGISTDRSPVMLILREEAVLSSTHTLTSLSVIQTENIESLQAKFLPSVNTKFIASAAMYV